MRAKAIGNGDPMQRANYTILLYPSHENKDEFKKDIKRSMEKRSRDLERKKDDTNKLDMSKGLIIIIDCGVALKEVPQIPGPEAVSIVVHQSK